MHSDSSLGESVHTNTELIMWPSCNSTAHINSHQSFLYPTGYSMFGIGVGIMVFGYWRLFKWNRERR